MFYLFNMMMKGNKITHYICTENTNHMDKSCFFLYLPYTLCFISENLIDVNVNSVTFIFYDDTTSCYQVNVNIFIHCFVSESKKKY